MDRRGGGTAGAAIRALVDALRPDPADLPDGAVATAGHLRPLLPLLDRVPLPRVGLTAVRWRVLSAAGAGELSLARLLEGHLDAVAILAEAWDAAQADRPVPQDAGIRGLLGVWAADPPHGRVTANRVLPSPGRPTGWQVSGTKRFCSGVEVLDGALVTAHAPDGYRLFHVDRSAWEPAGTWAAPGMVGSGTLDAVLQHAPATPVGGPGAYLDRPGFAVGGIGVGAVWAGAADGCRQTLLTAMPAAPDATALAHLGAVDVVVTALQALLSTAAATVDADPQGDHRLLAHRVRAAAVAAAREALDRTGRALGTRVTVADPLHARRVADLPVYLSQHHGDRDLAALGAALHDRAAGGRRGG